MTNVIRLPFRPRLAPEPGRVVDEWAKRATTADIEARLNPITQDRLDEGVRGDFETDGSAA